MVGTQEERFTPDKNVAQTEDTKRDEVMTFSYDMSLDPKYEKPTYPGTGNGLGGEEGEYDVVVHGRAAHVLMGPGYVAGNVDPAKVERTLGVVATSRNLAVLTTVADRWCR